MTSTRSKLVAIGLLLVVGGGLGWWFLVRGGNGEGEPAGATTAELREAVATSRRAIALLENNDPNAAIPLLEELRTSVPADPFAERNLAVGHLLRIDSLPDAQAATIAAASEAVTSLAKIEQGATPERFASRVAVASGNVPAAVAALERAIAIEPDDASLHYELWGLTRIEADEALLARGQRALVEAHRTAPSNVYVLLDLLVLQSEREDAELVRTAEVAKTLLEPYAAGIEVRTTADVLEFLDAAIEAVAADDWKRASRSVRIVANVVRPEAVSQSDRLRVERHHLEFVLLDFQPAFYEQAAWEPKADPPPIDVQFVAGPVVGNEFGTVRSLLARDVDLDGHPDIVLVTETALVSLVRRGETYEEFARLDLDDDLPSILAADLDTDVAVKRLAPEPEAGDGSNDGDATTGNPTQCHVADIDFVLWGPGGVRVVENRLAADAASAEFVPVESPALAELRDVVAATLTDIEHDGDLDIVAATAGEITIFANRGDLTFQRLTSFEVVAEGAKGRITSLLAVDLEDDLDVDLIVTGTDGATGWLENLRHGQLRWRADASVPSGPAIDVVDTQGNARWDLLAHDGESVSLRPLTVSAGQPLVGEARWSTAASDAVVELWDFDNDGRLDLLVGAAANLTAWRGVPDGGFEQSIELLDESTLARDVADLDGDGDLDVVATTEDGVVTLVNEGGHANRWLRISLRAQQIRGSEEAPSGRVNQYGLGSVLQVRLADGGQRRYIVRRPWTHIGLGRHDGAAAVRVLWTNGIPFNIVGPRADTILCERQSLKGSCPFLYTWDGERFVFATDLLWGSPIGLQFADGVLAPARPWENLLVRGDQLVPRDGYYEIRITEELWEVGYFDHVRLSAVDHPAEVDVFTNEKVGPPSVAEHRLHTVSRPREPVAVVGPAGQDLSEAVRARGEVYGRAFSHKYRQGLVDEHFLEIDLGPDAVGAERITLFLTGWLQPSDTSLNVALSHDPRLASPAPPALQVRDAAGEWTTVVPFTGFPGGKTKTIAVDVSDVFPTADRRLRLVTNMEFYWDHVCFTLDEPDVDVRERPLELVEAELRYRGFSRETLPAGLGPHRYDYEDVSTRPRWPAIRGGFTRYGDVRPLVAASDDRLVLLGPGDEMVLRFRVPAEPLPEGWSRDFVLHDVGWDKDADLNTVLGQNVEPLPFRAMTRYPYGGVEPYPDDRQLDRDRRTYHTRRQRHTVWAP